MTCFLILMLMSITGFILSLVTSSAGWFWGLTVVSAVALFVGRYCIYENDYDTWMEQGFHGDHFWFEWTYCKKSYYEKKSHYNPDHYVKIRVETFKKYFQVNNDRYQLLPGYVFFDNEDNRNDIFMIFPRRDLFKYYMFRREYLQNKQMLNVVKFVQDDIDKVREEAQEYVDKAEMMFKSTFGGETNNDK